MSLGSLVTENKTNGEEDYPDSEFTPSERRRLRKLLDEDKRKRWMWVTIRTWLFWIGGSALAISTGYQWIKDVIRSISR